MVGAEAPEVEEQVSALALAWAGDLLLWVAIGFAWWLHRRKRR